MICPRCKRDIAQRLYGPCISCRLTLRQLQPRPFDNSDFKRSDKADGTEYVAWTGRLEFVGKDDNNGVISDTTNS